MQNTFFDTYLFHIVDTDFIAARPKSVWTFGKITVKSIFFLYYDTVDNTHIQDSALATTTIIDIIIENLDAEI